MFALIVLLPLLYAISIALMPSNELFTTDLNLFPKHPTLQNFKDAFTTVPLLRFILNSFIMAGCITIGQIISCSLAAFAFSFLEFKGKGILFAVVMATMMVPGEATIISNYLTVGSWGILDTYAVLIIPYLTSAMGIFLFRQFYLTFPKSLYEAAKIDGASDGTILAKIMLPLSKPALSTLTIFTFVATWNDYLGPLIYLKSQEKKTIQLGLKMFISQYSSDYGLIMAGSVLSLIPVLIVFLSLQKYFVQGVASSGLKG